MEHSRSRPLTATSTRRLHAIVQYTAVGVNGSSLSTAPRFDLKLAIQETTSWISPPASFDRISVASGLRRQQDRWERLNYVS